MRILENMLLIEGVNYTTAYTDVDINGKIIYGLIYADNEFGNEFDIVYKPNPKRPPNKDFKLTVKTDSNKYTVGWITRDEVMNIIRERHKEEEY